MKQFPIAMSGEAGPKVVCLICEEEVIPQPTMFDDHNCPECNSVMPTSALKDYKKALRLWERENP